MATISSAGVGSGLDVNSIVTQLVALERKPIEDLQKSTNKLQTQLSSFGKLQSTLSTLRDAATKLTRAETWQATTASSSDAAAASATTGPKSVPGRYAVSVTRLASAQTLTSGTFAAPSTVLGSGTLTIELGTWGAGQTSFTPKAGATPMAVTVAAGSTLEQVRDAINAASGGVVASIVNDATGARLSLRSRDSGEVNAFRVTAADDDGNNTDAAGLSALAFDPSAGVASMTQRQAATNALATINGVEVVSASNTLTDVIDGLTIRLGKVTTAPVDIEIAQDGESIRKAITSFVDAYNELNKLTRDQTKYDANSKTGGVLQADRTVIGLQSQLRSLLTGTSGASTVYTRLADVGFDLQRDGSISLQSTRLDAALGRLPELRRLFSNTDTLVPANDGFATLVKRYGDGALGVDGSLSARQSALRDRIDRNGDRAEALEQRVAQVEKRLRAQYTALDAQMGQLNALSNYVTQQVAQFNRKT